MSQGEEEAQMWKLKNCPRCGGDMFFERGLDSWYVQCIQCSHETELKNIVEFNKTSLGEDRGVVLSAHRSRESGGL